MRTGGLIIQKNWDDFSGNALHTKHTTCKIRNFYDETTRVILKEKLRPLIELRDSLHAEQVDREKFFGSNYIETIDNTIVKPNIYTNWLFIASYVKSVHLSSEYTPYFILIESSCLKGHDSEIVEFTPKLCLPEDLGRNISMEDLWTYEKQIFSKIIIFKQLSEYIQKNNNIKYIFCNIDLVFSPDLIKMHPNLSTFFLECLSVLKQIIEKHKIILIGINYSNPLTNILTNIKECIKIYGNDYNFVRDILIDKEYTPSFENPDSKKFKKAGKLIYISGLDSFFEDNPIYTFYYRTHDHVFKIDYFAKKENSYEEISEIRREILGILSGFAALPFDGKMLPEPLAEILDKCKGRVEHEIVDYIIDLHHELREVNR